MNPIPLMSESLAARIAKRRDSNCPELWDLLDQVKDPEIPVLSLWDLGVLQDVAVQSVALQNVALQELGGQHQAVRITIIPTYSGCPALREMQQDIRDVLMVAGYTNQQITVETQLAPAWSTDMITHEGRQQLQEYGIAPPVNHLGAAVICPLCSSSQTRLISQFGSTACKALYRCERCAEPFDYFKCL